MPRFPDDHPPVRPSPCAPRPPRALRVGGLFAGVGGLELGASLALAELGLQTDVRWLVELDPYARAVLARHYPRATLHDDITTTNPAELDPVDLITFGFPCQDISNAGKQAGLAGARSGLFYRALEMVGNLRSAFFFVENVSAVRKYLPQICGSVAELGGYDLAWTTLRASDVGAMHQRARTFLLGRRHGAAQLLADTGCWSVQRRSDDRGVPGAQGEGEGEELQRQRGRHAARDVRSPAGGLADARSTGRERLGPAEPPRGMQSPGGGATLADRHRGRQQSLWQSEHPDQQGTQGDQLDRRDAGRRRDRPTAPDVLGPAPQPGLGRMLDGLSARLDVAPPGCPQEVWEPPRLVADAPHRTRRLKTLGNAVVPQQAAAAFLHLLPQLEALDP